MDTAFDALREKLSQFDGKAITLLSEAEAAVSSCPGYLDALIALVAQRQGHLASGASWLLKSALERGECLTSGQVVTLAKQLLEIEDWPVQLHICQSVRMMDVPVEASGKFAEWLAGLLGHKRPFVRAWSLDALGAVARHHQMHAARFNDALAAANADEAASVRARARHLCAI